MNSITPSQRTPTFSRDAHGTTREICGVTPHAARSVYRPLAALTALVLIVMPFATRASAQSSSWAPNVNLTGTDTVSLSEGNAQYTLTANETLTIQAGSLSATPINRFDWQFEVCQNAGGNFTLAFSPGTGISAIQWSGGSQPGYSMTASNGDVYDCSYNGTNLYCREIISNVEC
jgi:hypothetical protein